MGNGGHSGGIPEQLDISSAVNIGSETQNKRRNIQARMLRRLLLCLEVQPVSANTCEEIPPAVRELLVGGTAQTGSFAKLNHQPVHLSVSAFISAIARFRANVASLRPQEDASAISVR